MSRNTCGCFSFLCAYFNLSKGIPQLAALHAKSELTLLFPETMGEYFGLWALSVGILTHNSI